MLKSRSEDRGVTSPTAIISRKLKISCIVGTKITAKVFKTEQALPFIIKTVKIHSCQRELTNQKS